MTQPDGGSSANLDWIPETRLDDHAGAEPGGPQPAGRPNPPPNKNRTTWRNRAAIAASVATMAAVLVGAIVGLIASGDTSRRVAAVSERDSPSVPPDGFFERSSEAPGLGGAPSQQARVPVVNRLTNLGASEASVLASVAALRDERAAARAASEDRPAVSALSQVPHASSARYGYLRRVGAVAVILAGLRELDVQAARAGTTDRATSRERRQLDRLSLTIAWLNLSPYPPAQRLSELVTAAILQLGPLVAGDLNPRRSARLRRVNRRLGALGRSVVHDLDRAAASMSTGNTRAAGRLLAAVDRTLERIPPAS